MPSNPEEHSLYGENGSTPVPDPTLLTTAALTREISALKELMITRLDAMDKAQSLFELNLTRVPTDVDKQIGHLKELHNAKIEAVEGASALRRTVIETRLGELDKSIILVQNISDHFIVRVEERVAALKNLHEEKFLSIQTQFRERDVRTEQSSKDSKVAVDAALQAAKEAVGEQNKSSALAISKSEVSTIKQIDQITLMIQASNKGMDDKLNDAKERLTRIEGSSEGRKEVVKDKSNSASLFVAIAACIIAFVGLAAGFWSRATPIAVAQPQVVYVPAPTGSLIPSSPATAPTR